MDKIEFLRLTYAILYDKSAALDHAIKDHATKIPRKEMNIFGEDSVETKWREDFELWNTRQENMKSRRDELHFVWEEMKRKFGHNDCLVAQDEFAMKIGTLPYVE